MSKRNISNKQNKNNNKPPNSKQQYNVIINQNSTFNQDNSINIMLDGGFPYFQNYNYQSNDSEPSNQIYPFYDYQQLKPQNSQNNQSSSHKKIESNNNNLSTNNSKNNNKNNNKNDKQKNLKSLNNKIKKNEISPTKKKDKDILPYEQLEPESTNKIDYRYMRKCPIKEMISIFKNFEIDNKDNTLFWFATYGKLMKTKHLLKILNYYNNKPFDQQSNSSLSPNFKEKTLIIKDFEIYFHENSNKPFIRYSKGGTIYCKLYLLTLNQISQVFSYLNRIEYKIDYDKLNYLQRKGTFEIINDNTNGIILPFCLIYCLGKYMNINIYSFSNNIDYNINLEEISFEKNQRISSYTVLNNINNHDNNSFNNDNLQNKMNNTNINKINYKLPNSKKIVKLIKIINLNFPDFSIEDIINYLIPDNKYINSITKINEIKNIFFFKKTNQSKFILSSMVRDTIKGISIQTPKSLISSFCPCESIIENNSFKNSDIFQPTNKKYMLPIKDDYKFQTISTNEKDGNKNNPFIIYVCDNVQKINFVDNQNQNKNLQSLLNNDINNININNYSNNDINNINNNFNINNDCINNNNSKIDNKNNLNVEGDENNQNLKNKENDLNTNKPENSYLNAEDNQQKKINNQNNYQAHKKSQKILKEKSNNVMRGTLEIKKKQNKYGNDINNVFNTGNKKELKIQRISSDMNDSIKTGKFNSLTGSKNNRNKIKGTNTISHTNIIGNNNSNVIKQLNKSIESHNNYNAKYRLSKTSDITQRNKKKEKDNNNTSLLNKMNMNKKDINNPFFKTDS